MATARALALALDVPVLGVSTLAALAAEAAASASRTGRTGGAGAGPDRAGGRRPPGPGVLRRCTGAWTARADGRAAVYVRSAPFAVCDRDALRSAHRGDGARTLVVGDAGGSSADDGERCRRRRRRRLLPLEVRAERLLVGQERLEEPGDVPQGSRLAPWLGGALAAASAGATAACEAGEPGSPEAVKPIYVRSPDADIHITKMRDPWADDGPRSGRRAWRSRSAKMQAGDVPAVLAIERQSFSHALDAGDVRGRARSRT